MTTEQRAKLKTAGWTQVVPDLWRSPLTGRDYTEREVLARIALTPRYNRSNATPLYRSRR